MGDLPVHRIDVRAFRYATEAPERVEAAIETVVPEAVDPEAAAQLDRTTTEGHFGHPIDIYAVSLSDADAIDAIFRRLAASGALSTIVDELDARVNQDCELFVRLNKQAAFADESLELGDGIELRIKLEAYPATPDRAIENLMGYLDAQGYRS